jgi:uncharacterized phiE125 gp8 family phage protein
VTSVLITAPTEDVMTLAELKTALGVTSNGQDNLLEALRNAVVATLDPSSGGWLGRALRSQTWELRLPAFSGSGPVELPYMPVTEVSSVKYDDMAGDEHTLTEDTDYRVFELNSVRAKCYLVPPYLGFWPVSRSDRESVRIQYVAGYSTVPQPIKSAIALAVKSLQSVGERNLFMSLENIPDVREARYIVSDVAEKIIRSAVDSLLSPYRVW